MDKLGKIIAELQAMNAELSAFNNGSRGENEKRFGQSIRDYITNSSQYQYGGVVNVIATVTSILEELALETGVDDYATAAEILDKTLNAIDLKYEGASNV